MPREPRGTPPRPAASRPSASPAHAATSRTLFCPTPATLRPVVLMSHPDSSPLARHHHHRHHHTRPSYRRAHVRDTAEVIAKQALPMFLDVTATVTNWSADGKECSLVRYALPCSFLPTAALLRPCPYAHSPSPFPPHCMYACIDAAAASISSPVARAWLVHRACTACTEMLARCAALRPYARMPTAPSFTVLSRIVVTALICRRL